MLRTQIPAAAVHLTHAPSAVASHHRAAMDADGAIAAATSVPLYLLHATLLI